MLLKLSVVQSSGRLCRRLASKWMYTSSPMRSPPTLQPYGYEAVELSHGPFHREESEIASIYSRKLEFGNCTCCRLRYKGHKTPPLSAIVARHTQSTNFNKYNTRFLMEFCYNFMNTLPASATMKLQPSGGGAFEVQRFAPVSFTPLCTPSQNVNNEFISPQFATIPDYTEKPASMIALILWAGPLSMFCQIFSAHCCEKLWKFTASMGTQFEVAKVPNSSRFIESDHALQQLKNSFNLVTFSNSPFQTFFKRVATSPTLKVL